jgi:penicillin-binding protein 2
MAFGQGGTVITPIEEAVAYATFANGGTRYVPQIAAGIVSSTGKVVKTFAPKVAGHVTMSAADRYQAMLAGFRGAVNAPGGTATSELRRVPLQQAVPGRQDGDGQCRRNRSRRGGSWAGGR